MERSRDVPLTTSLQGGGQMLAQPDNGRCALAALPREPVDEVRLSRVRRRRETSLCVASTKDVPALYPRVAHADDEKCPFAGNSRKPSSGLEPETPSLPSSDEPGTGGKTGEPRARKPRKRKESAEDA
jgi:hypothetical protein